MLTNDILKEFTKKYQTREINVYREYIQNLFLSSLYELPQANYLLFKGGTALRIIYRSPRFSEDLDFSVFKKISTKEIEDLLAEIIYRFDLYGLKTNLEEAKPTSGGYLGVISCQLFEVNVRIRFEVSLRDISNESELNTIVNDFIPTYTLTQLSSKKIAEEKMEALKTRNKPRDWYDLYFMLRDPQLRKFINKSTLLKIKPILKDSKINFKNELSVLLPTSHHAILKDFKENLTRELDKYI